MRIRTILTGDERGTAVIELAIVAPLLLMILMGITSYGGYFWLAHNVQQAANDAARATLSGLTPTERQSLATAAASSDLSRVGGIRLALAATTITEDGTTLGVTIRYDASGSPFMRFNFLPLPISMISRSAFVRLGGF